MKFFLLFITFTFYHFSSNSQELETDSAVINAKLLLGNWGFDYVDFKDGTLVRDDYVNKNMATMLSFRKANAVTIMYHIKATTTIYTLVNHKLSVGTTNYKIEKLTEKELILSNWQDVEKESYKVLRFHYLATKDNAEKFFLRKFVTPNIRLKANKDTAYTFSEDFYPHFRVKYDGYPKQELDDFASVFSASYQTIEKAFNFPDKQKGRFGVQFDIAKTGQIGEVKVTETTDSVYNDQLLRAVASTALMWKNAEYQDKPVAIQFNYIFDYQEKKEEENPDFDPSEYERLLEKANDFFVKKNYEKAIKFYTKCVLMTDDAIEALYKRADCYFTVDALNNACSDWNYLAGKGQKRAEGLYLNYCMK